MRRPVPISPTIHRPVRELALLVVTGLALATLAAGNVRAQGRLVVAWDEAGGGGRLAGLSLEPPFALATATLELDGDARVRAGFGRVLHLSRSSTNLRVVEPSAWVVERTIPLGMTCAPRDVALVSPALAYVTCASGSSLLRVELDTGTVTAIVDLATLAVGSARLVMETLLHHAGRLYVQLSGAEVFPSDPHFLAVVDVASESIVDSDPNSPGLQAIALQGTAPRFKMQVVPGTNQLLVSSTGELSFDGGLELVDLDLLQSLGIVIREFEGAVGNDLGAFAMIDADRGWLVFATDIVLSSHLHPFTLSAGAEIFEADTSLFYFAPHLVHDLVHGRIFWPEPGGVQAFDDQTGAAIASATPLSGDPTDLALFEVRPPEVPTMRPVAVFLLVAITLAYLLRAAVEGPDGSTTAHPLVRLDAAPRARCRKGTRTASLRRHHHTRSSPRSTSTTSTSATTTESVRRRIPPTVYTR